MVLEVKKKKRGGERGCTSGYMHVLSGAQKSEKLLLLGGFCFKIVQHFSINMSAAAVNLKVPSSKKPLPLKA